MKTISGAMALELLSVGQKVWMAGGDQFFQECHGNRVMMCSTIDNDGKEITGCAVEAMKIFPKSDLQELLLNGLQLYEN
jgi:hypothetical protein